MCPNLVQLLRCARSDALMYFMLCFSYYKKSSVLE
jgi:hypothetical protein